MWALLPELLFPSFLLNVGISPDLVTLISHLRTTRLAGRPLEECENASQMAPQEHQIQAPVEGRDVLEGSISSGRFSLAQANTPEALSNV